ncbi:MAG: phospholipase D family protein [Caldimonas sp.]
MRVFAPVTLAMLGLLVGCGTLPSLATRTASAALRDTANTRLGQAVAPRLREHPGQAGIHLLAEAADAFAARMLLARAAERSLDVQYYIWRDDLTGTMLFEALRVAATRGVRVRLLLDDNNTSGLDPTLALLATQPGFEVRLFNPFVVRSPRWQAYLTDFSRLNRRMHNKSFTADNQVTIVGGRNIGDEYFGATDGVLFSDLDVMAIGPIVDAVSTDFDRYWNSGSSYPVGSLLKAPPPSALADFESAAAMAENHPDAVGYTTALRQSPFAMRLRQGELDLTWAQTRMVSDDPAKGLRAMKRSDLVLTELRDVIGDAQRDVEIVSPYFVPTRAGVSALLALAQRGVRIRVLTNSLEATDVAPVHAGYAKWRKALLQGGVELYELKRNGGRREKLPAAGFGGSSASSLHAKTFAADHARVFVGSFNFDPRSAYLNTELGFVIESPEIGSQVADAFDQQVPARSYEVKLDASGGLVWIERLDGGSVTHLREPGTGFWQRAWIALLARLPIEWLL